MNVLFMEVDLANMRSVREFCKNFLQKEKRLDVLINNAGGQLTEPFDGIVDTLDLMCICDESHYTRHLAGICNLITVSGCENEHFFFVFFLCLQFTFQAADGPKMLQTAPLNDSAYCFKTS